MELYTTFIGIDIGKFSFVVATDGQSTTTDYPNTSEGIRQFIADHRDTLPMALCVLEATGGYEMALLMTLVAQNAAIHRAHPRRVKQFIQSYGNGAKTDRLDALALARYARERHTTLNRFVPASPSVITLYQLVQRRNDLKSMLVAEKNRRQSPDSIAEITASCESMIEVLQREVDQINQAIANVISKDRLLAKKHAVLLSIPGIGEKVSSELLALMPELGELDRRQAASLAGLAPRAKDSGRMQGYRRVSPGRQGIKPMLYLAAMAARNSHSGLKTYYEGLIDRGKPKLVALVALMRKLIVIANARLKALLSEDIAGSHGTIQTTG